ncbi:hypothetical protein LTR37_015742 [Vermiconidia calcicola]|uniref:Uncharacterized protein n=1 Tax=Vermiconidia calcicola TaxID=1690605 RepID=A0ACC3MPS6_9PEZI|nr:hypothetical protein LTR37_015742 [Vermiconidia calcicola]
MSATGRDDSSESLFLPHDDHYTNEQSSRRRRLHDPSQHHRVHYPGDGLDFRRPVMSSSAFPRDTNGNERRSNAPVIDLTAEDATQESRGSERHNTSRAAADAGTAGSSRAQRLPRFGRALIEIESSGDEREEHDTSNLPGASYLALPPLPPRTRPQYSHLRRPVRPPSPPANMDDVEFVEARPLSRPQTLSRQPTPGAATTRGGPRSVTPYPTNMASTSAIDLTEEDDDVVLLNARQREGANLARPDATGGVGTRSLTDRGYEQIGHIANILREGGANFGGRLMQRLQGFGGLDGEIRAQQQAFEHFNHNHPPWNAHADPHPRISFEQRRAQERAIARRGAAGVAGGQLNFGGVAPVGGMPGMMDYGMTGFDMGLGGNRPPTPKYSPPLEPAHGFTRSPEQDEVVVCPNCGDELAMGDNDKKQEVWVVKGCGHAYCGECAQQAGKSSGKKGSKGKAPAMDPSLPAPFKKCVVEGCGKPAGKSSIIHVFLGS